MKKIIFAFFLSFGISFAQNGNILVPQASSNSSFDNWTFGGNIGATFGNYSLGVFITPRIGYKLTNDLELSANVNFIFYCKDLSPHLLNLLLNILMLL